MGVATSSIFLLTSNIFTTFIRHPGNWAFSAILNTKLPKIKHSCNSIKIFCTLTVNESYKTQQSRLQHKIQKLKNNGSKCDKIQLFFVSLPTK